MTPDARGTCSPAARSARAERRLAGERIIGHGVKAGEQVVTDGRLRLVKKTIRGRRGRRPREPSPGVVGSVDAGHDEGVDLAGTARYGERVKHAVRRCPKLALSIVED